LVRAFAAGDIAQFRTGDGLPRAGMMVCARNDVHIDARRYNNSRHITPLFININ
jgi:hypothetical protein